MTQPKSNATSPGGKRFHGGNQLPDNLPLPHTTANAFRAMAGSCNNIGLMFDRYLCFGPNWDMSSSIQKQDTPKLANLKRIARIQNQSGWSDPAILSAVNRWKNTVEGAITFKMIPGWRFVVGLGDKTALEAGFTFHRIYGYPMIPGSALKGLARAVALWEIAEVLGVPRLALSEVKKRAKAKQEKRCHIEPCETPLEKLETLLMAYDERIVESKQRQSARMDEDKALAKLKEEGIKSLASGNSQIAQFRQIFGTTYAAGEALFFEAVPAKAPTLDVDVMNVHYPDYYGEQPEKATTPPSDNQNPVPIPFLTVGQTPFWFAVGWRGRTVDEQLLNQAVAWLTIGLNDFGIGAKTAAGYGYFEAIE